MSVHFSEWCHPIYSNSFAPTHESSDFGPQHSSYNFKIREKIMQQSMSILIGQGETLPCVVSWDNETDPYKNLPVIQNFSNMNFKNILTLLIKIGEESDHVIIDSGQIFQLFNQYLFQPFQLTSNTVRVATHVLQNEACL